MSKSFEELPVWRRSREMVRFVYGITKNDGFRRDYSLVDQIRRSSTSVMSNTAEGFERGTNAEFIHFLYIAKGSAGEARAQLYIARDQDYITEVEFEKGIALARDVSGQLSKFIEYLKSTRMKGDKFNVKYKSWREEVTDILKTQ